eukprot:scaffold302719_cov32-Tisochrysis_lutea.AAC.1
MQPHNLTDSTLPLFSPSLSLHPPFFKDTSPLRPLPAYLCLPSPLRLAQTRHEPGFLAKSSNGSLSIRLSPPPALSPDVALAKPCRLQRAASRFTPHPASTKIDCPPLRRYRLFGPFPVLFPTPGLTSLSHSLPHCIPPSTHSLRIHRCYSTTGLRKRLV